MLVSQMEQLSDPLLERDREPLILLNSRQQKEEQKNGVKTERAI